MTKILAIETSCDETAVAIVSRDKKILSNIIVSQLDEHKPYGGVVPEIAARAHLDYLPNIVRKSLSDTNLSFNDIDAIAVTGGPGLIGGVIVGVMFAKSIAYATDKPFLAINHLEGHALTARLTSDIEYPFLLLLISGGHCQFIIVEKLESYKIIGQTLDDALGEAFDKVAKMLGFTYPGGPIIEKIAKSGDALRFKLPKSLLERKDCDFSFSGLKTAVKRQVDKLNLDQQTNADMAASFQYTVAEIIKNKLEHAINIYTQNYSNRKLVLAGGVAANLYLREKIKDITFKYDFELITPPVNLCTDNAAMIAWAAIEHYNAGNRSSFDFMPRDRWSL